MKIIERRGFTLKYLFGSYRNEYIYGHIVSKYKDSTEKTTTDAQSQLIESYKFSKYRKEKLETFQYTYV